MQQVASAIFSGIWPDGTRRSVCLSVGVPYPNDPHPEEWRCPLSLEPLHATLVHPIGGDPLQSLCLALKLGMDLLRAFIEGGGRLEWDDGSAVDLAAYGFPEKPSQASRGAS
jgi:hypothetical protein